VKRDTEKIVTPARELPFFTVVSKKESLLMKKLLSEPRGTL
jgi:hypothetical protein